jgi:hypothetical protein
MLALPLAIRSTSNSSNMVGISLLEVGDEAGEGAIEVIFTHRLHTIIMQVATTALLQ